MVGEQLKTIYQRLFEYFGPQHWWPGRTQFEIIVGAILTQNTNWTNVEKAIANLRRRRLLEPLKLHEIEIEELAALIRPAGYYRLKARRLKNFLDWLFEKHTGQLNGLNDIPTDLLRRQLLGVKGIGRETADSILLYALDKAVFVVDAYTARVMLRHRLIDSDADYEQIQDLFQSNLDEDLRLFNEYHALLVRLGKQFCRPKPKCSECPLNLLPHTIEAEYP